LFSGLEIRKDMDLCAVDGYYFAVSQSEGTKLICLMMKQIKTCAHVFFVCWKGNRT
jgi:hypothetical protein